MSLEAGLQSRSATHPIKRKPSKSGQSSFAVLSLAAILCGLCSIPLALAPGRSILSAIGGISRTIVGALHGRPLWIAAMPDVPWEAVDVGPAPTEVYPPHVWAPTSSRVVRLPGGTSVKMRLASASHPLAYTIEGLLSADETAQLRKVALKQLGSQVSSGLNSWHPKIAVLPNATADIVATMNRRTAEFLRLPERLFALANLTTTWYGSGGQYLGHHDAMERDRYDKECREKGKYPTPGGPRFATVLWYLTDVEDGGETMFPHQGVSQQPPRDQLDTTHPCSAIWGKLTVPAKAGTGIIWYNYLPGDNEDGIGDLDWGAFHRGCSVLQGDKLIATRWVPMPLPSICQESPASTKYA